MSESMSTDDLLLEDYFLLSLYLVNDVGELKFRTLLMAVVI